MGDHKISGEEIQIRNLDHEETATHYRTVIKASYEIFCRQVNGIRYRRIVADDDICCRAVVFYCTQPKGIPSPHLSPVVTPSIIFVDVCQRLVHGEVSIDRACVAIPLKELLFFIANNICVLSCSETFRWRFL